MSWTQLIFQKDNKIDTIELDITIVESANASIRLTNNPVEYGADVTDHAIVEPMTFTIEGAVSNASSKTIGQFPSAIQNLTAAVTTDLTKSQQTWDKLLELLISKTPFTLIQGLKSYENIILKSIQEQQDKDTSNALFFTATLQELIYVGTPEKTKDFYNETSTSDQMVPTIKGGLKNLFL